MTTSIEQLELSAILARLCGRIYFGQWSCHEDVLMSFGNCCYDDATGTSKYVAPDGFPNPGNILFAAYEVEGYEGSATLVFTRDGKLFEVHASHCSCNGLEECWRPEETSAAYLSIQNLNVTDPEAVSAYEALFKVVN